MDFMIFPTRQIQRSRAVIEAHPWICSVLSANSVPRIQ
jgi:hypothetical protein